MIGDTRMLFDAFDINSSGAITLDNMTFLESWDLDSDAAKVRAVKRAAGRESFFKCHFHYDTMNELQNSGGTHGQISSFDRLNMLLVSFR